VSVCIGELVAAASRGSCSPLEGESQSVKTLAMLAVTLLVLGCSSQPHSPVLVPIARVHYDGFREGDEIITTLKAHGIPATWEGEATVVFPILIPKSRFQDATAILQTNSLVPSGKVQLYPIITREVK
jgi:type III secretory pathway lipoprotein EscJ